MDPFIFGKFILWHLVVSFIVCMSFILIGLGMRLYKGYSTEKSKKYINYSYMALAYLLVVNCLLALYLKSLTDS